MDQNQKQKRNGTVETNTFRSSKYQTIETTSEDTELNNKGHDSKQNIKV